MKLRISLKKRKASLLKKKYFFRENNGERLLECDFCSQPKIRVDKNFHIQNRNKVKFWNKPISEKVLVCLFCLFEKQELKIQPNRKNTFSVYKVRYNNNQ